uniref:(northern house mosquito) hypothetical protein n=1 Tax=Culex pipiens TaxID=7175 RepID=A0A8D8CS11_CULPI
MPCGAPNSTKLRSSGCVRASKNSSGSWPVPRTSWTRPVTTCAGCSVPTRSCPAKPRASRCRSSISRRDSVVTDQPVSCQQTMTTAITTNGLSSHEKESKNHNPEIELCRTCPHKESNYLHTKYNLHQT